MSSYHLDTDVLIWACSHPGPERRRVFELLERGAPLGISAWAWFEFSRGPRTPEQLAAAELLVGEDGIVPLTRAVAERAGEVFRQLGAPRRRAGDVVIGTTAAVAGATLLTRNARDFAGIPALHLEALGAKEA